MADLNINAARGHDKILSAMNHLRRMWRGVVQAISFAVFGVGAWILALTLYPLVALIPASVDVKTAAIQKVLHRFFRLFLGFIEVLGGMEFHVEGAEALSSLEGGVVIANHPTILDVVVLISRMPQADCIVKKELWGNIFLRSLVTWAGYLPNDDGPGLMAATIERVRKGRKVIIFPEGTRSLPGMMHPFSNGFAHIAVRSPCLVWPVVITCRPPALRKGKGFFDVPAERPRFTASVHPPLNPAEFFDPADSMPVAVRKVAGITRRYFDQKVGTGGS